MLAEPAERDAPGATGDDASTPPRSAARGEREKSKNSASGYCGFGCQAPATHPSYPFIICSHSVLNLVAILCALPPSMRRTTSPATFPTPAPCAVLPRVPFAPPFLCSSLMLLLLSSPEENPELGS